MHHLATASCTAVFWPETLTDKEKLAELILDEIDETEWHYHYLPHVGLIPDWQVRYRDLAELIKEYFRLQ